MYNIDEIKNKIICGDCLEVMKLIPDNSVDSIVTDPPYELGFMGKSWDSTGIANNKDMWAECLRVLKPGGHLLAFSGTRTYHRMAVAIEDAGFEVRDMIEWVYGSGFPKSLNIGKKVDELQGNEREVIGLQKKAMSGWNVDGTTQFKDRDITKGTSKWEGWGTALKPAHEPICMARKPLAEKTVAENVLKYGTGGINIDDSRVNTITEEDKKGWRNENSKSKTTGWLFKGEEYPKQNDFGRFPANLIHDGSDEVVACFPNSKSTGGTGKIGLDSDVNLGGGNNYYNFGDSGNASRFFKSILYYPKASKSERNKGCEGLEDVISHGHYAQDEWSRNNMGNTPDAVRQPVKNNHPTVKPIALMEYLIKMVTPKGGIVLDPFAGSGTTCMAAKK